jgi:hypothetical protein
MLNKGPFVAEAVKALSDILKRMEKHHYKKRSLFRRLRVSTFAERLNGRRAKHARSETGERSGGPSEGRPGSAKGRS